MTARLAKHVVLGMKGSKFQSDNLFAQSAIKPRLSRGVPIE